MIYTQIDDSFSSKFQDDLLIQAAEATLLQQGVQPDFNELTIVITGDVEVRELNHQYLGIDAPTDVLSFSAGEVDPETGQKYLGDIIISYPQAEKQALVAGHPVQDELQLLIVHGSLHLLGHDHAEPVEKTAMWAAQGIILKSLGNSIQEVG